MAFGIICEYNPFHNGHLYQINEIKKGTNEPIICVMSGNFTQRGEVAIADKYARAEMALASGADIVLELPVPYCMASAEYFAVAGIEILHSVGVDKLCFGSECADAEKIKRIAAIACSPEFKAECEGLPSNEGSASAYFTLLSQKSGEYDIISNDILGIEYTKAIIKNGYDIQIFPIKREGSAYRETVLTDGEFPSAGAIRESIRNGNFVNIEGFVPASTLEILNREELSSLDYAKRSVLTVLRLLDSENLDVAISDKGLVNRILSIAHECTSYDEFEQRLQTKKYTGSAIRRAILYILLGIKHSDLDAMPTCTTVLAANAVGREYLSSIRKADCKIRLVTKPADADDNRQTLINKRADALYTICFENIKDSGSYIRKKPVIK